MGKNSIQIDITANDSASKVINLVGTAFEKAAKKIAEMVSSQNLAKTATQALADSQSKLKHSIEQTTIAMRAADNALKALAISGKTSSERLSQSFASLNIRSALDINSERQKLIAALDSIKNSSVASSKEIDRIYSALKSGLSELATPIKSVSASFDKLKISIEQATTAIRASDSAIKALAASGKALSQAFASLNFKSTLDISSERQKIISAFESVKNSGVASSDEIDRAYKALKSGLSAFASKAKADISSVITESGRLSQAFANLKIRSALDIELDKQKLLAAFIQIKNSGVSSADEINRAYKALKSGLSELASESKLQISSIVTAAGRLSQAFATLNIRTALDINAERQKIIAAFDSVKKSGVASSDEINRAYAAMKSRLTELSIEATKTGQAVAKANKQGADSTIPMAFRLSAIPILFNNITMAVETTIQMLTALTGPAFAMDKLQSQFKAASGSATLAAADFQFVRSEANRLGVSLQETAGSFVKFLAATKGTAVEGKVAKEVFTGVATASTALRLTTEETNGVLLAFSQMINKGRISAEELNQAGERLPGALELMAKSMGMTTSEFRKAAEEGRILSTELMTKLGPALATLYGAAAAEAANSPLAQINKLKTAIFELMAVAGGAAMVAVGNLAESLSMLANAAKNALAWVADEKTGASAFAAFAFAIKTVAPVLGVMAASLATAAAAYGIYTTAVWLANTATGAFTISLLKNPLFLFATAILGTAIVAIKALGDTFNETTDNANKAGVATTEMTEAQRKAAAERKQLEDDYNKAFGVNLERQLAKRENQYKDELVMLEERLKSDLKKTGLTEEEKTALVEKYIDEQFELSQINYQKQAKLREDDLKNTQAINDAKINDQIAFFKLLGQTGVAEDASAAQRRAKERQELLTQFKNIEADAKANGIVLVGFEAEKQAAIDALDAKQFADANLRGIERQQKELNRAKSTSDALIAEVQRKVAAHEITEQAGADAILLIQQGSLAKQLDLARQKADALQKSVPNSEEYKDALAKVTELEAQQTGLIVQEVKGRETAIKTIRDSELAAAQNARQKELNEIAAFEGGRVENAEIAAALRLQVEADFSAKVLQMRRDELAAINPETQVEKYEIAKKAMLDAEADFTAKKNQIVDFRAKAEKQAIQDVANANKEALAKRKADDEQAAIESRERAESFAAMWNNAIQTAADSVRSLSDAAYNAFATMQGLPLKIVENLDTVREAALKAGIQLAEMSRQNLASAASSGAWYTYYKALGDVSLKAQEVTVEFLNQKVVAAELAAELEKPNDVTASFLENASRAVQQLGLLDNSTLDKLKGQIDKVKNAMLAFTDRVIDGLKQLQDQWDNMTMSELELEEKRFQEQKAKWQADYNEAQRQGNVEAMSALQAQLDLINKINAANVAKINASNTPTVPGMATGGIVGGTGTGDNQLRWLDPREHVIRPEATSFWGHGLLAAINAPWTSAGKAIASRLQNASFPSYSPSMPRLAMATGGEVGSMSMGGNFTVNISVQKLDESTIRREVIPALEKYAKLRG